MKVYVPLVTCSNGAGEQLEARIPLVVETDELSVKPRIPQLQRSHGGAEFREFRASLVAAASEESDILPVFPRHEAPTIVLDLVQPRVARPTSLPRTLL